MRVCLALLGVLLLWACAGGPGLEQPPEDTHTNAQAAKLAELQDALDGAAELDLTAMQAYYETARRHNDHPEFRAIQEAWGTHMLRRADDDPEAYGRVARLLFDEDINGAQEFIHDAARRLADADLMVERRRRDGRHVSEITPLFADISRRAGWKPYQMPAEMDEWLRLELDGTAEYRNLYHSREVSRYSEAGVMPPEVVNELRRLEGVVAANARELERRQANDGFAINAREAFLRFRNANSGGRVDRSRGQRVFSPVAMGRETETFDDIWASTYARPFVVYVERPQGTELSDAELQGELATLEALLGQLWAWFDDHFVGPMGLERVLPMGPGGRGRDGSMYDTAGQRAEAEGWPLEIVIVRDESNLRDIIESESGTPPPGIRAYFSSVQARVVAQYGASDDADEGFHDTVLIHEVFHLLSDHYAANPIDWQRVTREVPHRLPHPRYPNLLVQEGITDAVSGHTRVGTGESAEFEFLQVNHLRLRNWQMMHASFDNRSFFRVEDLLACQRFQDVTTVGAQRFLDLGVAKDAPTAQVMAQSNYGLLMSMYYATACKAAYFFH
jgi:hypothetical protein